MEENFRQRDSPGVSSAFAIEAESENVIDYIALMKALWVGRKVICLIAGIVFVLVAATAFILPARYTSAASFIPPNAGGSSSIASALAGQLAVLGTGDLLGGVRSSGDLYAGILRSQSIAEELIRENDLVQVYRVKRISEAAKTLAAATNISVDSKSSIVTLEVTDRDPSRAQRLAAGYMKALQETQGRLALTEAAQRAVFFGQQLATEKDALENAEVNQKKVEEQSGLIAPAGQTDTEIRTIADTQAQIALRQVQLAALRQSATEQNPEVVRLNSEIGDLEGQLARLQKGSSKGESLSIPTSRVPGIQLEYVRAEREVKYHEALFEMLSRQYEAAQLDEARDPPVLQVLDEASYPDLRSSPKRILIMLGGLFGGLFAGCVWVLLQKPIAVLWASIKIYESS